MNIRSLTKKFLAEAERRGLKVEKSFSVVPIMLCSSGICGCRVGELSAVGFVASYSGAPCCGIVSQMGVALPCTKCKKLHNLDGSALIWSGGEVFLDKNGDGVVKTREGIVVHKFWTTASKLLKVSKKKPTRKRG